MLEKEFNTIVRRSLEREGGFGFKIPDPNQSVFRAGSGATKNPFDGFGVNCDRAIYWESKIFNGRNFGIDEMRKHQIENLKKIWDMEFCSFDERKYLPIILVGRPIEKGMRCYAILPNVLVAKEKIDLNDLPFSPVIKKELLINWKKNPIQGLTPITFLLEGQI